MKEIYKINRKNTDKAKKMINTYNEKNLHTMLKKNYSDATNGTTEVPLAGTPWICDVETENGSIVEIQTANLSALTKKTEYILKTGRNMTVVHPVAEEKYIETYTSDGQFVRRKKSPKKATIFHSLRGMTKLCRFFLHEHFTLEVLYVRICETRKRTDRPVQLENKSRRRLKNWIPMEKSLEHILRVQRFATKEDWLSLIPPETPEPFRLCDLQFSVKQAYGAGNEKFAGLMIWIFLKMGILTEAEKKGRSTFYRRA